MTTRTVCTIVAAAAVLGGVAGCSGATAGGVDRTAGHGSGTHTMAGGRSMADSEMADSEMPDSEMPDAGMAGMDHSGHGDGEVSLWATQKAGGTVMVIDGEGRPFYRSDADRAGPSCAGTCVAEFEPVTVVAGETPELLGVQPSAVGMVRRADGATQLTLGGAPLYRHAGAAPAQPDPAAYTARGWYVVTPSGDRVTG